MKRVFDEFVGEVREPVRIVGGLIDRGQASVATDGLGWSAHERRIAKRQSLGARAARPQPARSDADARDALLLASCGLPAAGGRAARAPSEGLKDTQLMGSKRPTELSHAPMKTLRHAIIVGLLFVALWQSALAAAADTAKDAAAITQQANAAVLTELDFADREDFEDAQRGLIAAGRIKIQGDGRKLGELMSLLDTFDAKFNIVTP